MTEPFFFNRGRGLTVREIAALTGAEPRPGADLDRRITGIAALDRAGPRDLAFLDKPKYASQLSASGAGACLTTETLRRARSRTCQRALRRRALSRLRRSDADALSGCGPAILLVRGERRGDGRIRASDRAPGKRRDRSIPASVIGPRAEIGTGTVINAGAVIGPRRAHRPRLRNRRQCFDHQ